MKKSCLVLAVSMSFLLNAAVDAANEASIIKEARRLQTEKNYSEALRIYETNLKNTSSERFYLDYATLLINLKKYNECEGMLDKAVVAYPKSLRIKNALGQVKYKNDKLSEASTLFSQVLMVDPENKYAKVMLEKIRKARANASFLSTTGLNVKNTGDGENLEDEGFSSFPSYGTVSFKLSNELSLEEQKELAKKLYKEMMELDKWAVADFIRLHKQVIEKCHLTDQAQESCWRLSNLYLLGVEPEELENCIVTLEHLLKHYPDTELMPSAKNRLLVVSSKLGDYSRVVKLYEELFAKDPEPEEKTYMIRALEYANALVGAGRAEDAKAWYKKVLEIDNGRNNLEARAAARKLGEL